MADLTIGEVGKILQLNLVNIDQTVSPPAKTPLDLTNASLVQLMWVISDINEKPKAVMKTVTMNISSPPSSGIVTYTFQAGDLVKPSDMGKYGVFKFSVQVTFASLGNMVLISAQDGQLSIKDDSTI